MYEKHHTMKGYKTKEMLDEERGEEVEKAPKVRMIVIPESIFEDFKELTEENSKVFEFMGYFAAT